MKKLFLLLFAMGLTMLLPSLANAKIYYVSVPGFPNSGSSLASTIGTATANSGIDTVYVGFGIYKLDAELIIEDVVVGGCSSDGSGNIIRKYPGAVNNERALQTVLDGNSLVLSLPSLKHRVATINKGGIIDGCLIRNGHARGTINNPNDTKGFGGGVLINTGGKLHNSIVRGNVAMNLQFSKTNPSYGGGVYVNGGDVANCIITFNLDDMGLGIGASFGTILNNTIVRNANAPRFVPIQGNISGTPEYRHYANTGSPTASMTGPYIRLDDFYMAATETTMGQYACFLAAIDLAGNGSAIDWTAMCAALTPMYGYSGITISKYLGMTATEISTASAFLQCNNNYNLYLGMSGTIGSGSEVFYPQKAASATYAAGTSGDVNYPADPLVRENFPMGSVSRYGSAAFCVWIGGMLPTEAQWEYAARKTRTGLRTTGTYTGGQLNADMVGWYNGNSGNKPHEVATLLSSDLGLYDMCGNLWEWCADRYISVYPLKSVVPSVTTSTIGYYLSTVSGRNGATAAQAIHNPIYSYSNADKLIRGGCYGREVSFFPLGYRIHRVTSALSEMIGFRSAACTGL